MVKTVVKDPVLEVDEDELLKELLNGKFDFMDCAGDDLWIHIQRFYKALNVLGKEIGRTQRECGME